MKITYTSLAISDLSGLSQYITDILHNPNAANRMISHIIQYTSHLNHMPYMGISLSSKIKRDTDLRYIICEKHLIFYRIDGDEIFIVRILDGRTNYIKKLFEE